MTCEEVKVEFSGLDRDHLGGTLASMTIGQQQHRPRLQQSNGNNVLSSPASGHVKNSISLGGCGELNEILNSSTQTSSENSDSIADTQSTIAILRRHPMYDSLVLVKRFCPCVDGYTLEFPTSGLTSRRSNFQKDDEKQDFKERKNSNNKECAKTKLVSVYLDGDDPIYQREQEKYSSKMDDGCEVVYVPMNGLIARLDKYEKQGISIDGRVYAFAMGLKTAEKILTSSTVKEIQETPPL